MINKKIKIDFVSTVPFLSEIDECVPKPSNKFMPEWWSQIERIHPKFTIEPTTSGNIKNCPAIPEYLSQGYIVPMWTDTVLKWDKEKNEYAWKTDNDIFTWSIHTNDQFLNLTPFKFLGKQAQFIFRADCPWRMFTPKGYSTYQIPLIYHFYNEFTVLPGTIDTDIHPIINQQVVLLENKGEIFIKRGTPLAQYIPYKREKYDISVRDMNNKDKNKIGIIDLNFSSKFHGNKPYKKLKRD